MKEIYNEAQFLFELEVEAYIKEKVAFYENKQMENELIEQATENYIKRGSIKWKQKT